MVAFIIVIIATSVSGAGIQPPAVSPEAGESKHPVIAAFRATGAAVESMDINGWAQINSEYMNIDDMKGVAGKAARTLVEGEPDGLSFRVEREKGHRVVHAETFLTPQVFLDVVVTSIKPGPELETGPQSYLVMTITGEKTLEGLPEYYERIKAAVAEAGGRADMSVCISGILPGELDDAQVDSMIAAAFKAAGARAAKPLDGTGFFSGCGYTPRLEQHIEVMGEKVNLNIAARYSDFENKTLIWIGAPVISLEY